MRSALPMVALLLCLGLASGARADSPIVPPHLESSSEVAYPNGAQGDARVMLILTIEKTGAVRSVEVESGAEPFASAAKQAVAGYRFTPATRDGAPINAKIRFEVTFHAPKVEPAAPPPNEPAAAKPDKPRANAPKAGAPKPNAPLEVIVTGDKPPPSVSTMSRAEVRQLPGAFGDPFRAIEILPGVTPIISGLPFFYVRGAPPGNVGYFLDGVRVPYLFHVAVGPSIVNPAMVERVDLYSGGYPARYGRYAGAIVSAETTAPRDDLHGEGNLRLFDVGAMVEKGFDNGRGTALLGGRYSYTAALLSLISPGVRVDYRDYQARFTYDITPKDRVSLVAFGAYDLLAQREPNPTPGLPDIETIVFGSEFYRFDGRYEHKIGDGLLRWGATWGFDQTIVGIGETRNARDMLFGTRVELTLPVGEALTVHAGADAQFDGYSGSPRKWGDPEDPGTKAFNALFPARTDAALGAWADVAWKIDRRVELTPGLRFDLFRSGDASAVSADGRLALRADVSKNVRLLHAIGLAHQPPSFIVPLPGLAVGSLQAGLQTAVQASSGVEVEWPKVLTATVTAFDDVFLNMSDTLSVRPPGGPAGSEPRSQGSAYGLEVYVRRRLTSHLGGFISYTLSRSTRTEGQYHFPSAFDRTHVLNTALSYDIGKGWRAGGRLTLYTGAPTQTSRLLPPSSDPPRDPTFYRIDLRVEKKWTFKADRWLSLVLEMMNVTLHKEVINGTEIGPISIPSIGLEGGI